MDPYPPGTTMHFIRYFGGMHTELHIPGLGVVLVLRFLPGPNHWAAWDGAHCPSPQPSWWSESMLMFSP